MMKIVINNVHGGFSLSNAAILRYLELAGKQVWPEPNARFPILGPTYWLVPPGPDRIKSADEDWHEMSLPERQAHNAKWREQVFSNRDIVRHDPLLVRVVEELADAANGSFAALKVVNVPDDVDYEIEEYDGLEWVAEKHRTWR